MHSPLDARDPAFIRAHMHQLATLIERYHDVTVTGLEHLPVGRALIVGNHNGGLSTPDMFALMSAYWQRYGVDEAAYGLMHDVIFRVPIVGSTMARLGAVPARPANAIAALERDARVLVYPGGDLDAFKASSKRHKIVFGGRRGFVRIALRTRSPIVPVVSVGAHETFHVLADGADFVRVTGLKRLARLEVLPVIAGLPWGLWVGPWPHLPLPVKMKLRALDPITWHELGPSAADDDAVVRRCCEQVRATMQDALDEMVREGGFGRKSLGEFVRSLRG